MRWQSQHAQRTERPSAKVRNWQNVEAAPFEEPSPEAPGPALRGGPTFRGFTASERAVWLVGSVGAIAFSGW
eukprot:9230799-Alexandrium_andersonii.AAC.1